MALVKFQYQSVSSDVNKVCFEEEQDISNTREKLKKKVQALLNGVDVGNEALMHSEVEALGYVQLSDMKYDDRNVVNQRVSTTALQLYLI